jgi:hypothetical protein
MLQAVCMNVAHRLRYLCVLRPGFSSLGQAKHLLAGKTLIIQRLAMNNIFKQQVWRLAGLTGVIIYERPGNTSRCDWTGTSWF